MAHQTFSGRFCFSLSQRTPCHMCCISFNQSSLLCRYSCLFHLLFHSFICSCSHKSFWDIQYVSGTGLGAKDIRMRTRTLPLVSQNLLLCGTDREGTGYHDTMWWVERRSRGPTKPKPGHSASQWELRGNNKFAQWRRQICHSRQREQHSYHLDDERELGHAVSEEKEGQLRGSVRMQDWDHTVPVNLDFIQETMGSHWGFYAEECHQEICIWNRPLCLLYRRCVLGSKNGGREKKQDVAVVKQAIADSVQTWEWQWGAEKWMDSRTI